MKTTKLPGFTAENALSTNATSHRLDPGENSNRASRVVPQMSCWRTCYDISDTNHELASCYRVCSTIKNVFGL
jgi:hypothetical protein